MAQIDSAIRGARDACGIAQEIDANKYPNLLTLFEESVKKYADKPAVSSVGNTLSYADLDKLSAQFACYVQNETSLKAGDRIAVQMPNLVQYPVVVWGAMRAGLIIVNTNPLYTTRELKHQLNDSGAKAIVVMAAVAETLAAVVDETPVEHVIMTMPADLHPPLKRTVINFAAKHVKKMIPKVSISGAISLPNALKKGKSGSFTPCHPAPDDIAVLQYTGGTTGVAKGAMLSHSNLVANMMQAGELFPNFGIKQAEDVFIFPLPLYHIYAFIMSAVSLSQGNHGVLIPNPRDLDAFVAEMSKWKFNGITGLNTLFVGLCNHEGFRKLDFSHLKLTLSGGMALTEAAANRWKEVTGCVVSEGYGLTETSPCVSINPAGKQKIGTIGIALPSTEICLKDDEGNIVDAIGERGELCVRGPQVMKGYWQRQEATDEMIDSEGWLATGDVAIATDDGYLKIVDRKKNMILVSGFNVYPNEIEDVVTSHPDVLECAAIGVPDQKSGEAIKVFVVPSKADLSTDELKAFLKTVLTGYKMPRHIELRDDLPKSNVGKILHRELRDEELKKAST